MTEKRFEIEDRDIVIDDKDLCIIPCFNDLKRERSNNMLYCVIDEKRGDGFKCYVREGNGFNFVGWLSIREYVDWKREKLGLI